ncbi:HEAT repeat domain-containing protein [Allomuricauda sp. d1]|uniref:HEAT repeat domain-containing protein n=1 Tax=Allomuricauda sp. d1 TaxID=3136725 RepID=UPI0031D152C0
MEKERFELLAIDYLRGGLEGKDKKVFEDYLKKNPEAIATFEELKESWHLMDSLSTPETSAAMDARFFEFLHAETEKNAGKQGGWIDNLSNSLKYLFRPQLAYGLILLGIGLAVGYFLNSNDNAQVIEKTVVSNQETEDVREKLVLTLLEQPSANKRLQGVSEAGKIESVDEQVMAALLQTLNNDPNTNVRLAAIESLTNYVDNPMVRQGLVQSIPNQGSPIVQVTLANLMSALQEKKSIAPFRKLLKEKKLDTAVKKKIENTIESII